MHRRHFIKSSIAAGMLSVYPFPYHKYSGSKPKYISDKIKLGNTGIQVSRMAIGTGTNGYGKSSDQSRALGIKGLADLLQAGTDLGVVFWDTADQYGTHPHLKEALKNACSLFLPRNTSIVLQSELKITGSLKILKKERRWQV